MVNLASPNPLPNRDFMRILRDAWGIRFGLSSPAWLVEIGAFFMGTESELILKSRRVIPGRLLNAGFPFSFPEWPSAAKDLVARCARIDCEPSLARDRMAGLPNWRYERKDRKPPSHLL